LVSNHTLVPRPLQQICLSIPEVLIFQVLYTKLANMSYTIQQLIEINQGCTALKDDLEPSYGYVPTKGAGMAFCILFGLSMLAHTFQFCWKRTWWCSVFAIGCLGKKSSSTQLP
jgi:hypothetical protein